MSVSLLRSLVILIAAAIVASEGRPATACGEDSDCLVAEGDYRIALPAVAEGSSVPGAIIYLHGYRGAPEGVMSFAALRAVTDRLGVALVAPRGEDMSWNLPGAFRGGRDDVAFIDAVAQDAIARFHIDPARIVVAGFSVGGSMTWYMACAEGQRYAGYAPIAGAFWEPYVEDCRQPLARIHHVHGTADSTVPLEGRKLRVATQGNVFKSFALLRGFSQCAGGMTPEQTAGDLSCGRQTCGGGEQELCLHGGGHSVRPEWIEEAWRRFAAEGAFP
jgi:polyhydroxybutyrate depolymerase